MKQIRLGDLTRIRTGKLNANAATANGKFPFFTCSQEVSQISSFSYDCECVLVAGNGVLNAKYYKGKFDAYQRTYIIESLDERILNVKYLYYFLEKYVERLRIQSIGGIIKYIKLNYLTDVILPLPQMEEQKRIADILDKADALRKKNQELLDAYDELLKATFLDMFGDPVTNPKGWGEKKLIEICKDKQDIKCGPFGTQLQRSEYQDEGVPLWGIPHINSGFEKEAQEYLTIKKAEQLDAYSLLPNDIVMSRKGKVGMCAIYPKGFPRGIMHSDVIRLRCDVNKANPFFIACLFHESRRIEAQIGQVSSGAIMAGINVSKLKNIDIHLPSVEVQNQFAQIVENIEAQKSLVKQSLQESEDLFNALVQKAFKGELI